MANQKISSFPAAGPIVGGNLVTGLQGGANVNYLMSAIAAYVASVNPAGAKSYGELLDAVTANLPGINDPLKNALLLLAPLISPALTGTPTAPTAAGGTANTQIATTAYVMSNAGAKNFADLLDKVTANLPVINTPLFNALALLAPKLSPALTGVPTAPTAAAGTSDTQIATTAFVIGETAGKAGIANARFIATNPYTITANDDGQILMWANTAQLIFNPAMGLRTGLQCEIWQENTGKILFEDAGGAAIHSRDNIRTTAGQYAGVTLCHVGGGQFRLAGDIS